MRVTPPGVFLRTLFSVLLPLTVVSVSCEWKSVPESGTNAAAQKPATLAVSQVEPEVKKELSECETRFNEIEELYKRIPQRFTNLSGTGLEEVVNRVEKCRDRLETFVEECNGEQACEAHYMLARLLLAMKQRYIVSLRNSLKESLKELQAEKAKALIAQKVEATMVAYLDRIIHHCEDFFGCAKEGHRLFPDVYKLLGDTRFHKGSITGKEEFQKASEDYGSVLTKYPDFPDSKDVALSKAKCLLKLHRTKEGVSFLREIMKLEKYKKSGYMPFFYNVLWQLHLDAGDIDGMIKHSEEIQSLFPSLALQDGILRKEKDAYTRYLGFSAFRKGYAIWASGDAEGAKLAFEDGLKIIDKTLNQVASVGKRMPELEIYKKRIQDSLGVLEKRYGQPPEKDLDEVLWATERAVVLGQNRGKAVAIMFRGYGDPRSKEILQALDKHVTEHQDSMALVALTYLQGNDNIAGQVQASLLESLDLGLQSAAVGRDPDARGALIRSFGVGIGSASLVVFDRNGNLAWWMQDPRSLDSQFVIAIMDRLASQ